MSKENSYTLAELAARVLDDRKAVDIVILDISGQSSFADYFVNATATNTRMLKAMTDEVEEKLTLNEYHIKGREGRPESGWILIDAGDVIINLFLADDREKYRLEKIWSDADHIEPDFSR